MDKHLLYLGVTRTLGMVSVTPHPEKALTIPYPCCSNSHLTNPYCSTPTAHMQPTWYQDAQVVMPMGWYKPARPVHSGLMSDKTQGDMTTRWAERGATSLVGWCGGSAPSPTVLLHLQVLCFYISLFLMAFATIKTAIKPPPQCDSDHISAVLCLFYIHSWFPQ